MTNQLESSPTCTIVPLLADDMARHGIYKVYFSLPFDKSFFSSGKTTVAINGYHYDVALQFGNGSATIQNCAGYNAEATTTINSAQRYCPSITCDVTQSNTAIIVPSTGYFVPIQASKYLLIARLDKSTDIVMSSLSTAPLTDTVFSLKLATTAPFTATVETPIQVINSDHPINLITHNSTQNYAPGSYLQINSYDPIYFDYPLGYTRGTMASHQYSLDVMVPPNLASLTSTFHTPAIPSGKVINHSIDPSSVESQKIDPMTLKLRIYASDDISGVASVTVTQYSVIGPLDLTAGTLNDGVYEKVISIDPFIQSSQYSLRITNQAGNNRYYKENDILNSNLDRLSIFGQVQPIDITQFSFTPNNLDASGADITTVLSFAANNPVATWKPMIRVYFSPVLDYKEFTGQWDAETSTFKLPITIPRGTMKGSLPYRFLYGWDTNIMAVKFKDQAHLNISTPLANGNSLGPMVTAINPTPGTTYVVPETGGSISFAFTINSPIIGFRDGTVYVMGSADPLPYKFKFTSLSDTTFTIRIPAKCISQSFEITMVELSDASGNTNLFYKYGPSYPLDPLHTLANIPKIDVTCPPHNGDTDPPRVESISVQSEANNPYQLNISLKIRDDKSGVSFRHHPHLYLINSRLEVHTIEFPVDQDTPDNLNVISQVLTFSLSVPIPKAFGNGAPVLVSLYGLMDNSLNMRGYPSSELASLLNITLNLPVIAPTLAPIIRNVSEVSVAGGQLTVYGSYLDDTMGGLKTHGILDCNGNIHVLLPIFASDSSLEFTSNQILLRLKSARLEYSTVQAILWNVVDVVRVVLVRVNALQQLKDGQALTAHHYPCIQ
eukprot:gene19561-23433_t